jgi:hypothetical protein
MNYVYIYKENDIPFYVGIGTGYRAWSHLKPSCYMPYDVNYPSFYGKIKKMRLNNIEPTVVKIYEGDRETCENLEEQLIKQYGLISEGGLLYNVSKTTGGRVRGKKYPMSEDTKKRYKETCKDNRIFKITKGELYELYITQGKTRKFLANYYGCSDVLIKIRLKEYGIKKTKNGVNHVS